MRMQPTALDLDWQRAQAEAKVQKAANNFIVGLDLGQARDPTALAVIEKVEWPHESERRVRHYVCGASRRWQLNTHYTQIVDDVAEIMNQPRLEGAPLVIDGSGVGRPVVDMFRLARMRASIRPVQITAGNKEKTDDLGYRHVAKTILVGTLISLMESRRITFAATMQFAAEIKRELADYRLRVTRAANTTFDAKAGSHDDLLVAIALACWFGERGQRTPNVWV